MPEYPLPEIGLAVCGRCGHGRAEHGFCSTDYPAVCTHPEQPSSHGDWGVCMCWDFLPGGTLFAFPTDEYGDPMSHAFSEFNK